MNHPETELWNECLRLWDTCLRLSFEQARARREARFWRHWALIGICFSAVSVGACFWMYLGR